MDVIEATIEKNQAPEARKKLAKPERAGGSGVPGTT
jgi:hypothetical protein